MEHPKRRSGDLLDVGPEVANFGFRQREILQDRQYYGISFSLCQIDNCQKENTIFGTWTKMTRCAFVTFVASARALESEASYVHLP